MNKKVNGKRYKNTHLVTYRRMDANTYHLLITFVWLLFIGGLCVLFHSGWPLLLLILWLVCMI